MTKIKNTFIMLILSMTFFITVFKLYYLPTFKKLTDLTQTIPDASMYYNPVHRALCPVTGYRCLDGEVCDCGRICGPEFEKVELHENVTLSTIQSEAGTYCVPKGLNQFLTFNAQLIYTMNGWEVVSKVPFIWNHRGQMVACANPFAANHAANYLYDYKMDKKVELGDPLSDPYEILGVTPRYSCRCESLDIRENAMIHLPTLPFLCFTDPCKRDTVNAGYKGWDGTQCDCGPRMAHRDPLDLKSPCVPKPQNLTKVDDVVVYKNVPCINKYSIGSESGFYCSDYHDDDSTGFVEFQKIMSSEKDPYTLLKQTYQYFPDIKTQ